MISTQQVNLNGANIMIVADDHLIKFTLSKSLTFYGARVNDFNYPVKAWKNFENQFDAIDLVITDFDMPRMNGMQLTERMLKLKPSHPIILLSGNISVVTRESTAAIGISAFFAKPVLIADLVNEAHYLLQSSFA